MRTISCVILALALTVGAVSQTTKNRSIPDREKLIGAWHLISMSGPDGKPMTSGLPIGMLIYTRDRHVSVQLMYPRSEAGLSNDYVQNGYEASFGTFDLNDATHTVTHHVQGSNTGDRIIGKDLPRLYQFTADGRLMIRSAHSDEHWSVTWQHY